MYGTGVRVSLVIAGKTTSGYWEHNPGAEERAPTLASIVPTLTPEQVAATVVRAVKHNQRRVIVPLLLRLFAFLHRLTPEPVEWLIVRTGWHR